MSKVVFEIDKPTSCRKCRLRFVIHDKERHYQVCALQIPAGNGYGTEAFFHDADLTDSFISDRCPLVDSAEYVKEHSGMTSMDDVIVLGTCYCECEKFHWSGDSLWDDNAEHCCDVCNKRVYVKDAEEKDIKCPLGRTYRVH